MPVLSEGMVLPLAVLILAVIGLGMWIDRREILSEVRSDAERRRLAVEFWRGEAAWFSKGARDRKWALVQLQLAIACDEAGRREPGRGLFEEAQAAAKAARNVFDPKKNPAESMGAALMIAGMTVQLGLRDQDVRGLEDAVLKFREALETYGEKVPGAAVSINSDLGGILAVIGMWTGDHARQEEALSVCRLAVDSPDCKPSSPFWAMSRINLSEALRIRGEFQRDPALIRESIAVLETTLAGLNREKSPLEWGLVQCNLGSAHLALGELNAEPEVLKAAIAATGRALEVCSREGEPILWAGREDDLARALTLLAEGTGKRDHVDAAYTAVRAALEIVTRDDFPFPWADTTTTLGRTLEALGRFENNVDRYQAAINAYGAALEVFESFGPSRGRDRARTGLERAQAELARLSAGRDRESWPQPTLNPDPA